MSLNWTENHQKLKVVKSAKNKSGKQGKYANFEQSVKHAYR